MIQKIGDFNICNSNSILKVLDPGTSQSGGVLNFELGTDVRPEVSTTTL